MSTLKVNRIENTSTTDGGVSIDAGGHVTIDGQQMPTAGPLSSRNLIINGAMQVAQRSTAPVAAVGYQSVDRWALNHSGASGGVTQAQGSSGGPTGFPTYFRITNTSTTTAANGYRQIYQYIEGQNVNQFGWDYTDPNSKLTLSFKVRASVSQLYYARFSTDSGTLQGFTFKIAKSDGTAIDANTWTDVSVVVPGNANITIDNDNGIGLGLIFAPYYGTDLTDNSMTLDAWAAHNSAVLSPDYETTWAATLNATFDITGVQLEVGSKATPFEHESYSQTLAKCQRYYQRLERNPGVVGTRVGVGQALSSNNVDIVIPFPTTMREAPTALEQSGTASDYGLLNATGSGGDCTSVPTFRLASIDTISVRFTFTGHVAAGNASIGYLDQPEAFLAWSAEL